MLLYCEVTESWHVSIGAVVTWSGASSEVGSVVTTSLLTESKMEPLSWVPIAPVGFLAKASTDSPGLILGPTDSSYSEVSSDLVPYGVVNLPRTRIETPVALSISLLV